MEETKNEIPPALEAANALCRCHSSLIRAVIKLGEKRATLEEKAIKRHFHELAAQALIVASHLHQILSFSKELPETQNHLQAQDLATTLHARLEEFHKSFDYDWNYFEQYFEHGFYLELTEGLQLLEKLRALQIKLKDEATT